MTEKRICRCEPTEEQTFYWVLATNEDGWRCGDCTDPAPGDPPGFRPDLDRKLIGSKADTILHRLHNSDFIYVSNSDHGESIVGEVAARCRKAGLYDQYTIIGMIMRCLSSHAAYWSEVSKGVLRGKDGRKRCHCGKLAKVYVVGGGDFCLEHAPGLFPVTATES